MVLQEYVWKKERQEQAQPKLSRVDERIKMDQISLMMAFEEGELSEAETLTLFQDLVDSGLAWKLQGSYGRMAQALIDRGLISNRGLRHKG